MKAKVTKQGLVLPKELFGEADEVEIQKENGRIVIVPLSQVDPIVQLGQNPIKCGISDGSANHDHHLYGSES